jgi:hypothetical protein
LQNANVAARAGRGLRPRDTLEASATKLFKALQEQEQSSHFSIRLADEETKHNELLAQLKDVDSIKESISHLMAAQQQEDPQEDMSAVLYNLKSAVSKMNAFVVANHNSRRGLQEEDSSSASNPEPATAASPVMDLYVDFRESMQCAAKAAQAEDLAAVQSCMQTIKQGFQVALEKVNGALDGMTTEELQSLEEMLAQRLSEAQGIPALAGVMKQDPGAIASMVADTIGKLLKEPAAVSVQQATMPILDFLMLLWMVPVSIVWGGVLWMFIGLWTYGEEYGFLGSLWFEISWILSGLACMMNVEVACGIWDPDKNQNRTSTILD